MNAHLRCHGGASRNRQTGNWRHRYDNFPKPLANLKETHVLNDLPTRGGRGNPIPACLDRSRPADQRGVTVSRRAPSVIKTGTVAQLFSKLTRTMCPSSIENAIARRVSTVNGGSAARLDLLPSSIRLICRIASHRSRFPPTNPRVLLSLLSADTTRHHRLSALGVITGLRISTGYVIPHSGHSLNMGHLSDRRQCTPLRVRDRSVDSCARNCRNQSAGQQPAPSRD